jgi:aspartyl-tRNA(Asn)/glutamyl-tRNA(Gln) amidotransferase subunit C
MDKQTVKKVARLARIEVSETDLDILTPQVGGIMKWIALLNEVNTDNVAPLANVSEITLPLRPDVVTDGGHADLVLANAPESTQGYFVVPKVVE